MVFEHRFKTVQDLDSEMTRKFRAMESRLDDAEAELGTGRVKAHLDEIVD